MKHTPKSLIIRCLVILLGTVIAAFGCASFVKCSSLGLAPVVDKWADGDYSESDKAAG